jgi:hypothetical protein
MNNNIEEKCQPFTRLQNIKKYFLDNYNKSEKLYEEIKLNEKVLEKLKGIMQYSMDYYLKICDNCQDHFTL